MSSGLRLASSGGKPLAEPVASPIEPAGPMHLARCPACAALNGQSATQCWSCETALSPADLILASTAESSTDAWASLVDLERDLARRQDEGPPLPPPDEVRPLADVPVWNFSAPVATAPGDAVPTLTDAMENYSFAITHAQVARRRVRLAAIALGAFGLMALVGTIVYLQMPTPALPALDATAVSTAPSLPDRSATPSPLDGALHATPEFARPVVIARAAPAAAAPPARQPSAKPRWTRAQGSPRTPRATTAAPSGGAGTADAAPRPPARREPCTAAVVALGLCTGPSPP